MDNIYQHQKTVGTIPIIVYLSHESYILFQFLTDMRSFTLVVSQIWYIRSHIILGKLCLYDLYIRHLGASIIWKKLLKHVFLWYNSLSFALNSQLDEKHVKWIWLGWALFVTKFATNLTSSGKNKPLSWVRRCQWECVGLCSYVISIRDVILP